MISRFQIWKYKGTLKTFALPEEHNLALYRFDGGICVKDELIQSKDLVWFESEIGSIDIQADEDARFISLSGQPINEPLKVYDRFAMNTQREIMDALADSTGRKMGELIEKF